MSPEEAIDAIGDEQGWDTESKLALCIEYIERQQSDAAFEDFLRQAADRERSA